MNQAQRLSVLTEETLDAGHDLDGEEIAIGQPVRSYDFAPGLKGNTRPDYGMDDTGPQANWIEGEVVAIGKEVIEGCPRYTINPYIRCRSGKIERHDGEGYIYPPVNGTRSILGGVTCGVVKTGFMDDWSGDGSGKHYYLTNPIPRTLGEIWEDNTILLERDESGTWWVNDSRSMGSDSYESKEKAQKAVLWEEQFLWVTLEDRMLKEAGLGPGWTFSMRSDATFTHDEGEKVFEILSEITSDKAPEWRLAIDSNNLPGKYKKLKDAFAALKHMEEWRTQCPTP
jgi:hypothetical protein